MQESIRTQGKLYEPPPKKENFNNPQKHKKNCKNPEEHKENCKNPLNQEK